ncbi:hypothetical protein [Mycobacterium sp. 4858]|uniref:hypothetical protein n=1 Tax=Mycobacterium sp. 4858 TaxID=2057185 RepID=UPI000C85C419|nr:hypothetical protein [Mycobacterium sp. 4858]
MSPARERRRRRAERDAVGDNRLALIDQMSFLSVLATGQGTVVQCVWIYERAIDFDGLERFRRNLGFGLMGRRIERSPLPFARHRWVSYPAAPDLDVAEHARPRSELSAWVDERARMPVNPEWGPAWHLGVAPFMDGSTAISLVASHLVVDGLGFCLAIADAVKGNTRDLGYPPPRSRNRLGAVIQDACQTAREAPQIARALGAAVRLGRRRESDIARVRASKPVATERGNADDALMAPAITIYVALDEWDTRAKALGGTSNALFAGFAAKMAERAGCRAGDGSPVAMSFPVSERTEDDTRANALSFLIVSVDPAHATTDLRDIRRAISQALHTLRETPEELLQLLPLAPLTPKWAMRRLADVAYGYTDVGCSAIGDIDPAVGRPDGTDAGHVFIRGVRQRFARQSFDRPRGILMVSGRIGGRVFITVVAYQLDGKHSKGELRELAAHTLSEFGLTGVID